MADDPIVDLLGSKGLEYYQPVRELAIVEHKAHAEEKKIGFFGATPVPLPLPLKEVCRLQVGHNVSTQQIQVILCFDDEECRQMDRREFRKLVSERLNAAGDALLAAWDELRGESEVMS